MNIGIFDSGIGGMCILHQAMVTLPNENYIFYADSDHVPYGMKSKDQVIEYVDEIIRFMIGRRCDAVVIACNTATSVAAQLMRERYQIPIIGIEPAVKPAVESCNGRRVLVVATPLTVHESKLINLVKRVDSLHLVDLLALPGLVRFAEMREFVSDRVTEYLREQLSAYDLEEYSELVLGCTHFNYFKDTLRNILPPHIMIIDGNEGTINRLKNVLGEKSRISFDSNAKQPSVKYFESGREILDEKKLSDMQGLLLRLERMRNIM